MTKHLPKKAEESISYCNYYLPWLKLYVFIYLIGLMKLKINCNSIIRMKYVLPITNYIT